MPAPPPVPSPAGTSASLHGGRRPASGTVLGGRYQLEVLVAGTGVAPLWRARDHVLDRPVAVRVLADSGAPDPQASARFLNAATRAGRLAHPGLARTFDAATETVPDLGPVTYLVGTWVEGVSLAALLADGPLPPGRAATLGAAAAEALAAAHAAGVTHGALHPGNVLVGAGDRVTLTDVGLAAPPANPPQSAFAADTADLCAVLYAALTARWPLAQPAPDRLGLAAAPRELDGVATPRQVRAGIPRPLDSLVMTGLTGASGPLTPARLAVELSELAASAELAGEAAGSEPVAPLAPPPRRRARLAGAGLVGLALLAAIAGVSSLALSGNGRATGRPPAYHRSAAPGVAPTTTIPVRSAHSFDPPPGDGIEQEALVPLAFDGNPATAWRTETYTTAWLGNLKSGVGIRVDLGRPLRVGTVTLTFLQTGQGVQLRAGNSLVNNAAGYRVLGQAPRAGHSLVFHPHTTARYWVIWLTRLPPVTGGYQGDVAEVRFAS